MTTHGTDRLRRSLDNQRKQGATTYAMSMEDMEALVREVEDERDHWADESGRWKDRCSTFEASADGWAARCAELMEGPRGSLAEVTVVEVDTAGEWEDSADFAPRAVFADADRAEAYAAALRSNGERVWAVKGIAVDPAVPDSWAAIENDATTSPASYCHMRGIDRDVEWQDMSEGIEAMACDLVARCKRLAGVE